MAVKITESGGEPCRREEFFFILALLFCFFLVGSCLNSLPSWYSLLLFAEVAYNSAVNKSTGFTPFKVATGRDYVPMPELPLPTSHVDSLDTWSARIDPTRQAVRTALQGAREDLLKSHQPDNIWHKEEPIPAPIMVEVERHFEVRQILDARKHKGQIQLLVQWKHSEWVNRAHVKAPDLVHSFLTFSPPHYP